MGGAQKPSSTIHEEIRLRRADGDWLWFEAAITDLRTDPDVNGYVANLRDITRVGRTPRSAWPTQRFMTHLPGSPTAL